MSNSKGVAPTDPDSLTKPQKANEVTLAFKEPTASFELVFAFGEPKYDPSGISLAPWTGGAVGKLGHTLLFDGVTKYPPCPCPHGPACLAPSPAMNCSNDLLMDIHASTVLPLITLTLTLILALTLTRCEECSDGRRHVRRSSRLKAPSW